MQWRLLPAFVAHALSLPGLTPLVLPWLGVIASTAYVAVLIRRRCGDPRAILGGTLLYVSTSAVIAPLTLLGLNDAWVWLGLLSVAFGRSAWALPLACLLCPWVDERFLIGFPLAWLVARIDRREPVLSRAALGAAWLVPYLSIRLIMPQLNSAAGAAESGFLTYVLQSFPSVAPLVPLGWWFGLRAAWAGVAFAAYRCPPAYRAIGACALLVTIGVTAVLAHDLSRSIAIVLPVALLGGFALIRDHPAHAPRVLLFAGSIGLLLPAAHVIYHTIQPISPFPFELIRVLRSNTQTL